MSLWTYMNIKGEGHLLTMIQGHSISTFSNFFFLGTAWSIEAKFYVAPPWEAGLKVWSDGLGHMTKMADMSIYDKNLKNHLESWFAALGTRVLESLFKWWPRDDLDLFYG